MAKINFTDVHNNFMENNLMVFLDTALKIFTDAGDENNKKIVSSFFETNKQPNIEFTKNLKKIYRVAMMHCHPDRFQNSSKEIQDEKHKITSVLNTTFNEVIKFNGDFTDMFFDDWFEYKNSNKREKGIIRGRTFNRDYDANLKELFKKYPWSEDLINKMAGRRIFHYDEACFILSYQNPRFRMSGWKEEDYKKFIEENEVMYNKFISSNNIDDSHFSNHDKFKLFSYCVGLILQKIKRDNLNNDKKNKNESESEFENSENNSNKSKSNTKKDFQYYLNIYTNQPTKENSDGSDFIFLDWINQDRKNFVNEILDKIVSFGKNNSEEEIYKIFEKDGLINSANMFNFDIEKTNSILEKICLYLNLDLNKESKIKSQVYSNIAQSIKNGFLMDLNIGNVEYISNFLYENQILFVPENTNFFKNKEEKDRERFLYSILQNLLTLKNYCNDPEKNYYSIAKICENVGKSIPQISVDGEAVKMMFENTLSSLKNSFPSYHSDFVSTLNRGVNLEKHFTKLSNIAKIVSSNTNVANAVKDVISGKIQIDSAKSYLANHEKLSSDLLSTLNSRDDFKNVIYAGLNNSKTSLHFQSENGLRYLISNAHLINILFDFINEHSDRSFISGMSFNLMQVMDKSKGGTYENRDQYLFKSILSNEQIYQEFTKNYLTHLLHSDGLLYQFVSTNYDKSLDVRVGLAQDFVDFKSVYGSIGTLNFHEYFRENGENIINNNLSKSTNLELIFESFMQGKTDIFFNALANYKNVHSDLSNSDAYADSIRYKNVPLSAVIYFAGIVGNDDTKANMQIMRQAIIDNGFESILNVPFSYSQLTIEKVESANFAFVSHTLANTPVYASIKNLGFEISSITSGLSSMAKNILERNMRKVSDFLDRLDDRVKPDNNSKFQM